MTINKNKEICYKVNDSIMRLADTLGKYLYDNNFTIERIDREESVFHYNFQINDEYYNISEAYDILFNEIPKEIVFEYKEYALDKALKKEVHENLINFYLKKKDE